MTLKVIALYLKMGQIIAAQFPHLSVEAQRFPKTAYGRRGVHGIVLEELTIRLADTFTVLLPVSDKRKLRANREDWAAGLPGE